MEGIDMGEGLKRANKAAKASRLKLVKPGDAPPAVGVLKLRVGWDVRALEVKCSVSFIDPATGAGTGIDHTFDRQSLETLKEDVRMVGLVQALAEMLRRVKPDHTDEHVTHVTNAAATLFAILETKCGMCRFDWFER